MNPKVYLKMAEVEKDHWWFCSRRKIVKSIIKNHILNGSSEQLKILSVGCGTGGNFKMLSSFGEIFAMDSDNQAIEISKKLNIGNVKKGKLPYQIPFVNENFDIVSATDVLEHVIEDTESLIEISKRLNKKGKLIITVPAHQYLWSKHDELHHHIRRYSKKELISKLNKAGYKIDFISYYNFFLFPLVFLMRFFTKNNENIKAEDLNRIPNKYINKILELIFSFEKFFLSLFSFPIGVSIIAVVSKK